MFTRLVVHALAPVLLAPLALAQVREPAAPRPGDVVARFAVDAPAHSPFVLHGTLPLPRGLARDVDLRTAFALRLPVRDGELAPAQAGIVSRAPDGTPDVVEIAARAELATGTRAGASVEFELVWSPSEPAPFPAASERVRALLAGSSHTAAEPAADESAPPRAGASVPSLALRTRDVFGNVYWAALSPDLPATDGATLVPESVRTLSDGRWRRVRRVHSVLAPVPTPHANGAPLAHLMGVHAYVTEDAGDDLVGLDLRVHNGLASGSRAPHALETALGAVYWRELELLVPHGWIVEPEVRDPFFGEPYDDGELRVFPLVKPLAGGKLHLMGPQAQFERRLVLAPFGERARARAKLELEGLAFCRPGAELWSWWNPRTARYFPARDLLATIDGARFGELTGRAALRAASAAKCADLEFALASGTARGWYVESGVLGWAHPWFVKEAGGVGGEGIATVEGHDVAFAASRAGYRYLALLHRMNVCRQSEASYDRFGDALGHAAWLGADGKIPFDFRTNGAVVPPCFALPYRWGPPVNAQVRAVIERGWRPPYDLGNWYEQGGSITDSAANLLAWAPHDDQHLVRYTKNTKALVWLGNDALAKDDLLLSGELYHLMRHESPHVKADWSGGITLAVWEPIIAAHPHQGIWFGREDGWGIDAACAAYSVASPEWRARTRPWFDRLSKLLLDASLPSGLIQRFANERLLDGRTYAVTQTFESFFLMHALRCMSESVYRGVDDVRRTELEQLLVRGVEYLFWGPAWARLPNDWQPDPAHPTLFLQGPRQAIAIAPLDEYITPPFCDVKRWGANYLPPNGLGGGVEIFHPWQALAYASDATQATQGAGLANRYLKRALACGVPHTDFNALLADFWKQRNDPSQDNSANWIGLAGRIQAAAGR